MNPMRQLQVALPGPSLDYAHAMALATTLADDDKEVIEPVLMAWYDRKAGLISPAIPGANVRTRWRDYGLSHGGELEIDVGDDFAFIYAEGSPFDPYEASPYANLRDEQGNEYLCQINQLRDTHHPDAAACVRIDEWTSKLT